MLEIRSYRRVFDLERRIYRIDRLRLNPAGVPVRGVVYYFGLLLAVLLLDAMPLIGAVVSWMPWYVRAVALPGAGATLLAVVRIDGRAAHLVGWALLRYALEPGCLARLRACQPVGSRWYPPPLTILPDGSEGQLRGLRYRGPGRVTVTGSHELLLPGDRRAGRRGMIARHREDRLVVLREAHMGTAGARHRTIVLRRGALVEVKTQRSRMRREARAPVRWRRAKIRRGGRG